MSAGRRAGAALVGLLLGLGTLVVTARVVRDSIGSGAESAPASTSVGGEGVVAGATGPRLGAAIDVGHSPGAVAAAQDAVWVAAGGRLVHVDAHTGRVVARVRVGEGVSSSSCGVAVGAGAVWVVTERGNVAEISLRRNRLVGDPVRLGGVRCVAAGAGAVWATSPGGDEVVRIDPRTKRVTSTIRDAGGARDVAVGMGAVWVAGAGAVLRIDPGSNLIVARIAVEGLVQLAVGAGAVWVAGAGGVVGRIDPTGNQLAAQTVRVATRGPVSVAVGGGFVWAGIVPEDTVVRIDPARNDVVGEPIRVGKHPLSLAYGSAALWVANTGDRTLDEIKTSVRPARTRES